MAHEVTSQTFIQEVINSDKPVVIDFFAEWCGPCVQMSPHFEAASKELSGQCKFVKVNVDADQQLAIKHHVSSIPTLVFYNNGKMIAADVGFMDKHGILERIQHYFGK